MKRAVIYARVSTERQADEGLSVESQIEACRRKANELDAAVVAVYRDDGISGTTDARPGFRAAIRDSSLGGVDFLLCWSSSRFARDQHDAIRYKRDLAARGTKLVYASQALDLDTDGGWLADSVQQIIDESYSRQVSADTRRSMMRAASEGYFMGGRVPYGYQVVAAEDGRRKRLVPRPDEAAVVRMIFERSARGEGAVAIARTLNAQGFLLRGKRWGKTTLLNLLKSEVYMGKVIYNRFERKRRRERPEQDWIRVQAHEALVTPEVFKAVQLGLEDRSPAAGGNVPANTKHVFAGLARCGCCSAGMKMTTGTGRAGRIYHYYACNSDVQGKGCALKPIRADLFDSWLLSELLDRVLTEENVQGVIDRLDNAAVRWAKDRAARRSALVLEMRTAESRRAKLFDVIEVQGRDTPGLHEMAPRLRELNEQIRRVEVALMQIEDERDPMVGRPAVSAAEAVAVLRGMVRDCEDAAALRGFVASIVDRVVIDEKEVRMHYHPECLIRDDDRALVHSTARWLPVRGLLRTATVVILRPDKLPSRLVA